jgi:putative membrane protein
MEGPSRCCTSSEPPNVDGDRSRRRGQTGDAGVAMILVMLVMMVGAGWWGRMHGGSHRSHHPQERDQTALELLDEAYVRDEITREEYLQKREDLMGGSANAAEPAEGHHEHPDPEPR